MFVAVSVSKPTLTDCTRFGPEKLTAVLGSLAYFRGGEVGDRFAYVHPKPGVHG